MIHFYQKKYEKNNLTFIDHTISLLLSIVIL